MRLIVFTLVLFVFCGGANSDELDVRYEIADEAAGLFIRGNFSALDDLAAKYRTEDERTPAGSPKLKHFYDGILETVPPDKDDDKAWQSLFDKADEWISSNQNSATPQIAKASLLMQRAWAFRGPVNDWSLGFIDEFRFRQYAKKARVQLQDNHDLASRDPNYYVILIATLAASEFDEAEFYVELNKGLTSFPNYDPLYLAAVRFYMPQWYGKSGAMYLELERLAERSIRRTESLRGLEIYARIYWAAGQDRKTGLYIFDAMNGDHDLMSQGMRDLVERYPDQWNFEHVAFFACLIDDYELAGALLEKIETPIYESAWYRFENFEICKKQVAKSVVEE